MTPALPLGHELEAEWRFRVIYENNVTPTPPGRRPLWAGGLTLPLEGGG